MSSRITLAYKSILLYSFGDLENTEMNAKRSSMCSQDVKIREELYMIYEFNM